MTYEELRDHFAGLAMQGMLSACTGFNANPSQLQRLSCSAYMYADAMLKAREATPEQLKKWELPQ
jgi:hypothetical protein